MCEWKPPPIRSGHRERPESRLPHTYMEGLERPAAIHGLKTRGLAAHATRA